MLEAEDAGLVESIGRYLDIGDVRVITTGGDEFEAEREQWDDGNNVLAVEPGVVVAYERNVHQHQAPQGRHRGHHHPRLRDRPQSRPAHCLSCPIKHGPAY